MSGVEGASSNCVDDGDSDTNEVDYQDYRPHVPGFKRYPLHDCCEFGNAESLRQLIFVRKDDSDDSSSDSSSYTSSSDGGAKDGAPLLERDGAKVSLNLNHEILIPQTNNNAINIPVGNDENNSGSENATGIHDLDKGKRKEGVADKQQVIPSKSTVEETKSAEKKIAVKPEVDDGKTIDSTPLETKHINGSCDIKVETLVIDKDLLSGKDSQQTEASTLVNMVSLDVSTKEKAAPPTDSELQNVDPKSSTSENKGEDSTDLPMAGQSSDILDAIGLSQDIKDNDPALIISPGKPLAAAPQNNEGGSQQSSHKSLKKIEYYCPYDLDERDEDENTPIHVAIHSHKLDCVRLLLSAGANVHKRSDGSSPIHLAISMAAIPQHSNFAADCLSLLREYNCDLSMKDDSMHTPLYLACMMNSPRCASIILSDMNGITTLNLRADRTGGRPLHACTKFDVKKGGSNRTQRPLTASSSGILNGKMIDDDAILTRLLLATPGIEIDSTNNYGRTPLHIAAMYSNWSVARYLLQAGANPKALDRRRLTPWALANKRGFVIPNDLLPLLSPNCNSSTRDLIMDPNSNTIILHHEICNRHRSCPPIVRSGMSEPPPENIRRLHVLIQENVGILRSREFQDCSWELKARRAAITDILKVHEYSYLEKINQVCSSMPDHSSAIASLDPDTTVSRWSFEAALHAAGSVCEAVDKVMAGDYRNAFCAVRPPGHHAGPRGIVSCPNDPEGSHGFCLFNNVAIGAAYARSMYRNDGIKKVAIIDFDVHHGNGTEEIIRTLIPYIDSAPVRTPFAVGTLQTPKYRPWLNEEDIKDVFFASTHGYGPRERHVADNGDSPEPSQGGWFYPASGKTMTSEAIADPNFVDRLGINNFLLTQTWTRMAADVRSNCCKIINVGLQLPRGHDAPGMQRIEVRDAYRRNILPQLLEFNPDMIFISAGFDGHKKDSMNFGYCGLIEDDYEWITEQIVKVANTTCSGRIVSVLEGGYKIHGGIVSPFARSVASHVRALQDGGSSRELFTKDDAEWESRFEHSMVEEKERRRQSKLEKLKYYHSMDTGDDPDGNRRLLRTRTVPPPAAAQEKVRAEISSSAQVSALQEGGISVTMEESTSTSVVAITSASLPALEHPINMEGILQEPLLNDGHHGTSVDPMLGVVPNSEALEEDDDNDQQLPRKRRRNQVDYKQLFEQMKKESSLSG